MTTETRTPIFLGESGAQVVRVRRGEGASWIEKTGLAEEMAKETEVMLWMGGRLPVARVLEAGVGFVRMTDLPGVPLTEVGVETACAALAGALRMIHAVPVEGCPFVADWETRVVQAEGRLAAGLVDEEDFDDENEGRTAQEVLAELSAFPSLPLERCFTHGDACLENFLAYEGRLSGIVDLGRAGVTHPAQDWALALRSVRGHFGVEGERMFRSYVPADCLDESLLRRFRLLDEMF